MLELRPKPRSSDYKLIVIITGTSAAHASLHPSAYYHVRHISKLVHLFQVSSLKEIILFLLLNNSKRS